MPRSKKDAKPTDSPQSATKTEAEPRDSETIRLAKWARRNGAIRIRLPNIEIDFSDSHVNLEAERQPQAAYEGQSDGNVLQQWQAPVPPNLDYLRQRAEAADAAELPKSAINRGQDDPDAYARDSDAWANQVRLPRR